MIELVRSFLLWSGIGVLAIVIGTFAVITTYLSIPFDRKRRFAHIWPHLWATSVVKLAWRTEIDERRWPPDRHFVIAANHQSLADIIVCLHMRHNFKFIAKSSVFKVPFLGWFMYPAGYIPLVRGNRHSIADAMERARTWLGKGVSVLFYPEGTRSPDGEIRAFKPGAFRLAIETGTDVLPVLLYATGDMLPKNSFYFTHKKSPMRLIVGDPISVAGLTLADVPALAERTRQTIIEMQRELEARDRGESDKALRATG